MKTIRKATTAKGKSRCEYKYQGAYEALYKHFVIDEMDLFSFCYPFDDKKEMPIPIMEAQRYFAENEQFLIGWCTFCLQKLKRMSDCRKEKLMILLMQLNEMALDRVWPLKCARTKRLLREIFGGGGEIHEMSSMTLYHLVHA